MESIDQLRKSVESVEKGLFRLRSKHVNAAKLKSQIRNLVQSYFKHFRGSYGASHHKTLLEGIDNEMQDLLRHIQKRTLLIKYKGTIKILKSAIDTFEVQEVSYSNQGNIQSPLGDGKDSKIIETLSKIHQPAALSYEQALIDLNEEHRKSWRGTAVELREALRELLDHLAPHAEVQGEPSFKLEPNTKRPTVRQKVIYILKKRRLSKTQIKAMEDAINIFDDLVGKFIRSVYETSSEATHVPMTKENVARVKNYLVIVLLELLEIKT